MSDPIGIGGVTPLTTIDFPGRLACVVYCRGCPWRCRYCHNTHLQRFHPATPQPAEWTWTRLTAFLRQRSGFLDGVVFSGGEATFQPDLPGAMRAIRALGFEIALHTAGPDPQRLAACLPHVDWVGLDIKAPLDDRYDAVTGGRGTHVGIRASLRLLLDSRVEHELRTTVHPELLSNQDIADINSALAAMGAGPTRVQRFRAEGCRDIELCAAVA